MMMKKGSKKREHKENKELVLEKKRQVTVCLSDSFFIDSLSSSVCWSPSLLPVNNSVS